MNSLKHIVCPVSKERINERVTRINAFFGILMVLGAFLFNSAFFVLLLAADFYIRAFTKIRFSPIGLLSNSLVNALELEKKEIDKAPKIFAARLGFLMSAAIFIFMLLGLNTAAIITGGILVFFATLEFALALCMGCILYSYFILPFYK